ncbi:alpha/beta hydrolase [Psychrosphaera sp.]|nr:alpha/beta hydrolase [Psychrosphaera sp.]
MYFKLLITSLFLLLLNGCMTLAPSEQSLLANQTPIASNDYAETLNNIRMLNPNIHADVVEIEQKDGNKSIGIHVKQKNPEFVVLYFGPNNFPIEKHYINVLPLMLEMNADVYWFDYRGFGFTGGEATLASLTSDAKHVFNTINNKSDNSIVVHGLSLGSILAIDLAANEKVSHLVLEGSVTNVNDWMDEVFVKEAKYSYGIPTLLGYVIKPFVSVKPSKELLEIDNVSSLNKHKGNLLMLSAEDDWETPPSINKSLYKSLTNIKNKELHVIENVGHLNLLTSPNVVDTYLQFLRR